MHIHRKTSKTSPKQLIETLCPQPKALVLETLASPSEIARTSFPSSGWSHRAKVFRNCVATFGRRVHSETAVASTSFTSKVFYSTKLGGKHVENHPMLSEKLKTWNKLSQKLIQIGFREVLRILKLQHYKKTLDNTIRSFDCIFNINPNLLKAPLVCASLLTDLPAFLWFTSGNFWSFWSSIEAPCGFAGDSHVCWKQQ